MALLNGEGGGNAIVEVANYSALPAANTVPGELYAVLASQGTYWLPGSLGGTYYSKGLYYSDGTSWIYTETPYNANQATVNAGTNDEQFVTPKTLKNSSQFQYLDATSSIQTQLNRLPFWIAGHSSISLLDSTTYGTGVFLSIPPQASTGGGASSWKFPFAHTITKVVVVTRYAVAGSNEASVLALRNQSTTTDNAIGNLDYSLVSYVGASGFVQEFTVSIAVNTTDYYWLKEATPAWVTNPTNVAKTIYFY